MSTRLLAYTENAIFARGLQVMLQPEIEVVVVSPSPSAIETVVEQVRPDVLLLDSMRADVGAISAIHNLFASLPIIAWINTDAPELSLQMLEAGAVALLQNCCTEQEVRDCLAAVSKKQIFVPHQLGKTMWMSRRCKITPREGQLMNRVAQGLANKEIAAQLGISEGTVKVYLSRLFTKVGVADRYELALLCLRNGSGSTIPEYEKQAMPYIHAPVKPPTAIYLKRRFDSGQSAVI